MALLPIGTVSSITQIGLSIAGAVCLFVGAGALKQRQEMVARQYNSMAQTARQAV